VPGRELAHPPPDRRRAGERDDPYVRRSDQRLADVRATGQDVQQPGRQARLLEDAREQHATRHRGTWIGLEHDGVAERQRGRHRPDREDRRYVERRDHGHDPGRQAPGQAQPLLQRRQDLAERLRGQAGCLVAHLRAQMQLEVGHGRHGSGIPDHPALELLEVLLDRLRRPPDDRAAFLERRRRPRLLRGRSGLGCRSDVLGVRDADPADLVARGRFDDRGVTTVRPGPGGES
jgi:hypothetical protein